MQAGERYVQSARWLFRVKAKKRHLKDALLLFETAAKFDQLDGELGFMMQFCERQIEALSPQAP